MSIKISEATSPYNERRYSRPWIAKVDFTNTPQGEFIWGQWIGDPGRTGLLEITVEVNDIVAIGQKDYKHPKQPGEYHLVSDTGLVKLNDGKAEALKVWRERRGIQ